MPKSPEETLAAINAFLAEPRNVMVAAIRKDGRPQMTPNWFLWDGERFFISTAKTRRKYPNFVRDPRVQLAVDEARGYRTLLIDGMVEIIEDIDAQVPYFTAIVAKHNPEAPAAETIRARLVDEQRVILSITPAKPVLEWTRWGF